MGSDQSTSAQRNPEPPRPAPPARESENRSEPSRPQHQDERLADNNGNRNLYPSLDGITAEVQTLTYPSQSSNPGPRIAVESAQSQSVLISRASRNAPASQASNPGPRIAVESAQSQSVLISRASRNAPASQASNPGPRIAVESAQSQSVLISRSSRNAPASQASNPGPHRAVESVLSQGVLTSIQSRNAPNSEFEIVDYNAAPERMPTPSAPPEPCEQSHGRSRSGQRVPHRARVSRDIACPTCDEQYGVDIFQCARGHSACSSCRARGVRCALCRQPLTDTRNYALQDLLANMKFPCRNAQAGCSLTFRTTDMAEHLTECPFQVFQCPMLHLGNCFEHVRVCDIARHFAARHPLHRAEAGAPLALPLRPGRDLRLVTISRSHFLLHVLVHRGTVKMAVQLLGSQHSAAKWTYDLHVYNKSEPRRKYLSTNVCTSAFASPVVWFGDGDCAALALLYATTMEDGGEMAYKLFIRREGDEQPECREGGGGRGRGGRGRGGRGRGGRGRGGVATARTYYRQTTD